MKKIITTTILLLLCFLGINGQAKKDTQNSKAEFWKEFVSEEAGFKILFPGEPKSSNEVVMTTPIKRTNYRFEVSLREGYFAVHFSDHPLLPKFDEESLKADYEFLKNQTAKLVKAEIIREKEISVGGNAGLEVVYKLKNEAIICRYFLVDKRLYQNIVAISYSDLENKIMQEKLKKFFDSFSFIEKDSK